jgi:hypothetical protein
MAPSRMLRLDRRGWSGKNRHQFQKLRWLFPAEKYGEIYFAANESGSKLSARVLAGWRTSKLRKC